MIDDVLYLWLNWMSGSLGSAMHVNKKDLSKRGSTSYLKS
jgi:hypothetical protein